MSNPKQIKHDRDGKQVNVDRYKAFCREYTVDFNGTQAAIRAGFSSNGASKQAVRLLANAKIQKEIARLVELKFARLDLAGDKVLADIKNLAESDLTELFNADETMKPVKQWPKAIALAVSGFEVEETKSVIRMYDEDDEENGKETITVKMKKVKFWDKTKALEMLGRNLKLFTDVINSQVTNVNITLNEQQVNAIITKFMEDYY